MVFVMGPVFAGSGAKLNSNELLFNSPAIDSLQMECPEDISTYTDINECTSDISNNLNLLTPDSALYKLTWVMNGATIDESGTSGINQIDNFKFNEGATTVTYKATNLQNNTSTCSFTVLVSDNQVPRLTNPPGNSTVSSNENECGAFVNWDKPLVIDNCTPSNQMVVSNSHNPGTFFPIGTTEVFYRINDGIESNELNFSFLITVTDYEAPVLVAPENVSIFCGEALPRIYSDYNGFYAAGGSATDNCTIKTSSFKLVSQEQDGSNCPYIITRTYQIADVSGNVSTVEQLVIAEGEEEQLVLKSGMTTFTSTATGGNWNDGSSWVGGAVPLPSDDVIIIAGATITLVDDRVCTDITNNGTLTINGTNTLQVNGNLLNGGTITLGDGKIIDNGNWTNSGTFTAGTNGTVEFTGSSTATIGGTATTAFKNLQINKGSDVGSVVNVSSDITISNLILSNGLISIIDGTTDISGINSIPRTAGIEVNGTNAELNTGNFSITNAGLIRIAAGTATFGYLSGNSVHTQINGAFVVNGGEVNVAGRLENTAGDATTFLGTSYEVGLTVSGGTINLSTIGNGSSGTGSLNVTAAGYFDFSGGTINFIKPSSAPNAIDLHLEDVSGNGTKSITGAAAFRFGNSSNSGTYTVNSKMPLSNLSTYNASSSIAFASDVSTASSISIPATLNGTYTFQFDDGSGNLLPVSIDLSGATFVSGANITVTMQEERDPNNANTSHYLNRYWTVSFSGISGYTYDLIAQYLVSDVVGGDETTLIEGSYNGTSWTNNGNVDNTNHLISLTGLTSGLVSLSAFAIPTAELSGTNTICEGVSATLSIALTGAANWEVVYRDGSNNYILSGISSSPHTFNVNPAANTTYTLVSVNDENLAGTVDGSAIITVNPTPTINPIDDQEHCAGEIVTVNAVGGNTVEPIYTITSSDDNAPMPESTSNTDGSFVIDPNIPPNTIIGGEFTYLITLSNGGAGGCAVTEEFKLIFYSIPEVEMVVSCASGANGRIQVSEVGSSLYPAGAVVQYRLQRLSDDAWLSDWQTSGDFNGLEEGIYTVFAQNSLHPECFRPLFADILGETVTGNNLEVCQGYTVTAEDVLDATSYCFTWSGKYHTYDEICTNPNNIYAMADLNSSSPKRYVEGPKVQYTILSIFKAPKGEVTIKDCKIKDYAGNASYTVYKYPFYPLYPEYNYVETVTDVCPNAATIDGLDPNTPYVLVLNSSDPSTQVCTDFWYTTADRVQTATDLAQVEWFTSDDLNVPFYWGPTLPVTEISGFTGDTSTPGTYTVYAGCATGDCRLPISFIVHPIPYFEDQLDTICSGETTNILLKTYDDQGNSISYEWYPTNLTGTGDATWDVSYNASTPGTSSTIEAMLTYLSDCPVVRFMVRPTVSGCVGEWGFVDVLVINSEDFTLPDEPEDVTVACASDIPDPDVLTITHPCLPAQTPVAADTDNGGGCESDPLIITRTWTFNDACNDFTYTQIITVKDIIAPVLADPPAVTYCVVDILNATYDGEPEPAADIIATYRPPYDPAWTPFYRPDYFIFEADNPDLDLDPTDNFSDNCTAPDDIVLHWSITDSSNKPVLAHDESILTDIPGQVSAFLTAQNTVIKFTGAEAADVTYIITYWLVDLCGNTSEVKTAEIIIKPRPQIIKTTTNQQ